MVLFFMWSGVSLCVTVTVCSCYSNTVRAPCHGRVTVVLGWFCLFVWLSVLCR